MSGRRPASRAGPVDRSTLIRSGMKIPAMSVRFVVGATFAPEDQRVDQAPPARASARFAKSVASTSGEVRL